MSRRRWRRLLAELERRGLGERESGAFLLARRERRQRRVVDFIPFDELDPDALNGAISIRGAAFGALWNICAERGLRVVGDVHTHPGDGVQQSITDQRNPMVATAGHFAVILPRFAQGIPAPQKAGVHVYQGDRTWVSHYDERAAKLLRRTWW
jgi:Prokaryotic homologs of the JAB domain